MAKPSDAVVRLRMRALQVTRGKSGSRKSTVTSRTTGGGWRWNGPKIQSQSARIPERTGRSSCAVTPAPPGTRVRRTAAEESERPYERRIRVTPEEQRDAGRWIITNEKTGIKPQRLSEPSSDSYAWRNLAPRLISQPGFALTMMLTIVKM